ncbi:MAG: hypothetical protein IJ225_10560 [Solobacterium sp.]|nr:hypothetical protein [Solobacterium sp.]
MPTFYTWVATVLLPIALAVLGSSWVGDAFKAHREAKSGKATTDQIMHAISNLKAEIDEDRAITARVRIVRFNDELIRKDEHSKESFDQTLSDIDTYEDYCRAHPDFENNKTKISAKHIKDVYERRLEKGDFL